MEIDLTAPLAPRLEAARRTRESADNLERAVVLEALAASTGNVRRAAALLGVSRNWLEAKLRGRLADLAPAASHTRGRPPLEGAHAREAGK